MNMYVAVLYVLRLYEVVLAASDREDLYQATVERIQRFVLDTYTYFTYIHTCIHTYETESLKWSVVATVATCSPDICPSGWNSSLRGQSSPIILRFRYLCLTAHFLYEMTTSSYEAHSIASGFTEDGSLYTSQSCRASYGKPRYEHVDKYEGFRK